MTSALRPSRINPLGQLWFQVLAAMTLGVVLGWLRPELGIDLKPLGDAFIALVKMMIAPIIFCTVAHGVAGMNDMRRVGRVAVKTLIYFEVVTTIALIVALIAVNLWRPGAGMNIDAASLDSSVVASYAAQAQAQSLVDTLLHIIPTGFLTAFVDGQTLQVVFVALLTAAGIVLAGEPAKPVFKLVESLTQVLFRIVGLLMWAAPIGAFGAIAFTVGKFGAASLLPLGALILEFYLVCLAFVLVVLGGIALWIGVSIWRLLGFIREELLIVLATSSSEAVLPRIMIKLRSLGIEESVVGLVIPTGYSFNLDGPCLYLATVVVFLAQATNTPLGLGEQIGLLAVLLLTSKGAAGVAGAALVVLAGTLGTFGAVPVASVALVVGIHRLLGQVLAMVNLIGNALATIVIAKWENAVDFDLMRMQIGLGRDRAAAATASSRE